MEVLGSSNRKKTRTIPFVRAQGLRCCTIRLQWSVRGLTPDGELRNLAPTLAHHAAPTCQLTACARASLFHVSSMARQLTARESSDSLDPATRADRSRASTHSRLPSLPRLLTAVRHPLLSLMPRQPPTLLSRPLQHSATWLSRSGRPLSLPISRPAPRRLVGLRRTPVPRVSLHWVIRAPRRGLQALGPTTSSLLRHPDSRSSLAKTRKTCRTSLDNQMRTTRQCLIRLDSLGILPWN